MQRSRCLLVNLRTVQKIRKELNESNGDYEGTAGWKSHSGHFDMKKTELIGEIQAMIDDDPSKSIPAS